MDNDEKKTAAELAYKGTQLGVFQGPELWETEEEGTEPYHECPHDDFCYSHGFPNRYPRMYWLNQLFAGNAQCTWTPNGQWVITSAKGTFSVPPDQWAMLRSHLEQSPK